MINKYEKYSLSDQPFFLENTSYEEHYHPEMEIVFILEAGQVKLNNLTYDVKAQDLVIICPNTAHLINCNYKSIVFHLDFIGLKNLDAISKQYLAPIQEGTMTIEPIIEDYEILNIVSQLVDIIEAKEPFYELLVKEILCSFFYALYTGEYVKENNGGNILSYGVISKAIDYIEENYQQNITLETLAGICNYSKSYFMKVFKERTGKTSNDYLIEYRLNKALELLEYSTHPIHEIITMVGFFNVSNFNRLFKKRFGISPERYRIQKRNQNRTKK